MNPYDPIDHKFKQLLKSKAQNVVIPDAVQLAVENALSSLSERNVKKRSVVRWRWAAAVIAVLFILGTVSIFTMPTFAEVLRSLFKKEDYPDIGLLRAQEMGLVHHPHIKVKDEGYTLIINEAVADPTRVTIALKLFDKQGKHDRNKLVFSDSRNKITIKDEKGNIVGSMYDKDLTKDYYYMVAFFNEPLQTNKITIEGDIRTLGKRGDPQLEGDWSFSFDIDMREANRMTHIEELSGSYTTPHGMKVTLKRLTRMVQGARFELETELDDAAMARSPGELWEKQKLSFHFESLVGAEIHSVNPRKSWAKDFLMTSDYSVIGKGRMRWSYTFQYLPEDEPFRFVLDGYSVAEKDGNKFTYRPAERRDPLVVRLAGDTFELVGTSLQESKRRDGSFETVVSLYGKMENEFFHEQWKAYDSAGKQYDVSAEGIAFFVDTLPENEALIGMGERESEQPYVFRIPGLDQIPDELTLERKVVDKRYHDPDWSVLIK